MANATRPLFLISLLVVGLLAIYGGGLQQEFVPLDDVPYVSENAYVQGGVTAEGLQFAALYKQAGYPIHPGIMNLWHPATWVSWMVDVETGGGGEDGAWRFKLTNLFLHTLSAVFLMLIIQKLGGRWVWGFLAAGLWAFHPLAVEPVSWVSARKDVLSTAAALACVLCYVQGRVGARNWLWVSVALFGLAVTAKPNVVVLPGLLIALDVFLLGEGDARSLRGCVELVVKKWPYVLLSLLGVLATLFLQYSGTHSDFVSSYPLHQRVLAFPSQLGFSLQRLFLPWNLSIDYPHPVGLLRHIYTLVGGVILVASGMALWNALRGKFAKEVAFGVAWFFIAMLPVSGLAYVGPSFSADRYLYFPLAGLCIGLAVTLGRVVKPRRSLMGVGGALAMVCLVLSYFQASMWDSGETLFTRSKDAQPRSALAQGNYGAMMKLKGDLVAAEESFKTAMSLNPYDYIMQANLAGVYGEQGRYEESIAGYRKAVSIYPNYSIGWLRLGNAMAAKRNEKGALEAFLTAAKIPDGRQAQALWLAMGAAERMRDTVLLRKLAEEFLKQPTADERQRALARDLLR